MKGTCNGIDVPARIPGEDGAPAPVPEQAGPAAGVVTKAAAGVHIGLKVVPPKPPLRGRWAIRLTDEGEHVVGDVSQRARAEP